MYPNIFICGQSGSGKSTSLRNLDPESTIIMNTENKALPFKGAAKFKKTVITTSYVEFKRHFARALESNNKVIVIDSFTSLQEQVLEHCKATKKGFDVWSEYASILFDLLKMSKGKNKYVVFIGISEAMQDETGAVKYAVKVDGRSMKGAIEKEFVLCLWTHIDMDKPKNERFLFSTTTDGKNTAKAPMEMFEDDHIQNDLNEVIKACDEYYGFESKEPEKTESQPLTEAA